MKDTEFENLCDDVMSEGWLGRWVDRYNTFKTVRNQKLTTPMGQTRSKEDIAQMKARALIDSAITRYKIKAANVIYDKLAKLIDRVIGNNIKSFINNDTNELKKDLVALLKKYAKNDKQISEIPDGIYNDFRSYYDEFYNEVTAAHKKLVKNVSSYSVEKHVLPPNIQTPQVEEPPNPL